MANIYSWGRTFPSEHKIVPLTDGFQASKIVQNSAPAVVYGMGRSYGDVCLNPNGSLWTSGSLDKYIHFDGENGILICESGVLLKDIQKLIIPRGWILPVTPGTQLITVGGAIANDIHGKNHHLLGSFGDNVLGMSLLRTDGEVIECSPDQNEGWFAATVGGIGLTGVILQAALKLRRVGGPWLDTETIPFPDLKAFFELSDSSEADWEHTVSWIDCITNGGGRGLFMRGNHLDLDNRREVTNHSFTVPFVPPISFVNQLSLRAFNTAYYTAGKISKQRKIAYYEKFFYPLDNVHKWNRIYGPKGFFQYQCVVPRSNGQEVVQDMLKAIAKSGNGSFLAVLKTFGNRKPIGIMSFPSPGVTLALDFPNRGDKTEALFKRLDAMVEEAGGRLYLAKDARMSREMFERTYASQLESFLKYRDHGISSSMSRRLIGE